jgi:hypothetical protein
MVMGALTQIVEDAEITFNPICAFTENAPIISENSARVAYMMGLFLNTIFFTITNLCKNAGFSAIDK